MIATNVPLVDVEPGVMATVVPAFTPPVFLRLAAPRSEVVDGARQLFLRAANDDLRTCSAEWRDGAGVLVEHEALDPDALAAEVHALGRVLRALTDETIARSYLELMDPRVAGASGRDAKPEQGG